MKTFSIPGSWELTQTLHLLVVYFQVLQNSWNYGSKCPKSRKSQLLNTKSLGVICVLPGFLVWCFAMTNTVMATIIFHVCCDESKRRLFWSDQCRKCKSSDASKMNFLFKYYTKWLQEYCFLHVGTFSD